MKGLSIAVVIGLLALLFAPSAAALYGDRKATTTHCTDTASTSKECLAADAAARYKIFYVFINTGAQDEVTVQCGSTDKIKANLDALSGFERMFYPLYIECADNEAINIVKSAGVEVHATFVTTKE